MNEPFIPLNATAKPVPGQTDFRVTILNPTENPRPFRSLNRGPGGSGQPKSDCQPSIKLQRDGARISAVHIQCSCGQLIELACVYPSAQSEAISSEPSAGESR